MRLGRTLRLSLRALSAHRVRAALAVVSVGAGVAAVVLTSAIGSGMERSIARQIESLGVNLLVVRPVQVGTSPVRRQVSGTVTTLRADDGAAIGGLPEVARVAPALERSVRMKAGTYATKTRLLGTTSSYFDIRRFQVRSGRLLDPEDERAGSRVVVLGARVAAALFEGDPVGRPVRIDGAPFDVVGVLAPKGAVADGDDDNQVVVPMRTALRRVFNSTYIDAVFVSVGDPRATPAAKSDMAALLRDRHRIGQGEPDFEIQDAARYFSLQRRTAGTLGRLTTGLAAIALLVGGVGIMGLMLLGIRERTGEIGLRTAVGATPRDILIQFLLEATVLALAGWLSGLALAGLAAGVVALRTAWPLAAPVGAVLTSLAAAVTIGLGFGSLPARRASRIPPVRALVSR